MRSERLMRCMEVWGGNRAVDNGVVMPGLDAWVYARPFESHEAGGDVHYVSSCATGRITRLLVADVSGHGDAAAGVAEGLRDLMRRYVNYLDQSRFVSRMNQSFSGLAREGQFATAVVGTYWAPTARLTISNAGHPRPMVYRVSTGTWSALCPGAEGETDALNNLPLGVEKPTAYDELSTRLHRGDLLLLYSDSLIEARDGAGRQLGEEGLRRLLDTIGGVEPDRLIGVLLETLGSRWTLVDDVTVMLLRRNELRMRMGLRDMVVAGVELARRGVRRILGRPGPVGWPQVSWPTLGDLVWRRSESE